MNEAQTIADLAKQQNARGYVCSDDVAVALDLIQRLANDLALLREQAGFD